MNNIFIKSFSDLTKEELYNILSLRSEVFIVEQKCIYQDIDHKDQFALHVFLKKNNQSIQDTKAIDFLSWLNKFHFDIVIVSFNSPAFLILLKNL